MSSRSIEKKSELWQATTNNVAANTPNFNIGQAFNTSANFSSGQNLNNNQNFSTGANFNGQISQGQNANIQFNTQDNKNQVYYNNPNHYNSSSANQSFGQVDFKV
jgi:hypothetical protein